MAFAVKVLCFFDADQQRPRRRGAPVQKNSYGCSVAALPVGSRFTTMASENRVFLMSVDGVSTPALQDALASFGDVELVTLIPHKSIGFATFRAPEAAYRAVRSGHVVVGAQRIRVCRYDPAREGGGGRGGRARGGYSSSGRCAGGAGFAHGGGALGRRGTSDTNALAESLGALELEGRAPAGLDVVWLDTPEALRAASAVVGAAARDSHALAVDVHGVKLGREGSVSILTLCGGPRQTVYAVDVARLRGRAFEAGTGLRELLQDATLPKLFFDVRSDANALFYHFGVKLSAASVVDLQLLDAAAAFAAAARAGASEPERLPNFVTLLKGAAWLDVSTRARSLEVRQAALDIYAQERSGTYAPWLARPLSAVLLEHAADIRFFHEIYVNLTAAVTRFSRAALECAMTQRLDHAHSLEYRCDDRSNGNVDSSLAGLLSGSIAPSPPASDAPAATPDVADCVICCDAPTTHAITPCGHKCLCKACAQEVTRRAVSQCPVCRVAVSSVLQIY